MPFILIYINTKKESELANTNISNDLSTGRFTGGGGFSTSRPRLHRSASSVITKIRKFQDEKAGNAVLMFPEDTPKYYMSLRMFKYSRKSLFETSLKTEQKNSVYLPLPAQGIVDSLEIDYTEEALGIVGGGLTAGQNIISDSGPSDSTGGSLLGLGANALLGAGDALLPGASGAAQAFFGVSPNKFLTILLKGPRYKRHEFTWKLYPRNKKESDSINKIVVEMQNAASVGLSAGGLLFDFPNIFYLEYVPNPKYLYKFKPAVIESFTVNYAPNGVPSFYRGRNVGEPTPPECVEIRARFVELEYWLRGQYNTSNDSSYGAIHRKFDGAFEKLSDAAVKEIQEYNRRRDPPQAGNTDDPLNPPGQGGNRPPEA